MRVATKAKTGDPIIALVVARGENGAIGRGGDLPWRLSTDLRQFRKVTLGKPVIMGRLTFKSLGRALDHRANIVLSRDPDFVAPGALVAGSLDEGLPSRAPRRRSCRLSMRSWSSAAMTCSARSCPRQAASISPKCMPRRMRTYGFATSI